MPFNQKQYISDFNKGTYKMFPFRVRRDNDVVINKLNSVRSKNRYITQLIEKDVNPTILTLKQIKTIIMPILAEHHIYEVYLFGSYARGEANSSSDIDIYCENGDIKTLINHVALQNELKTALDKDVDVIFIGSSMDEFFEQQMKGDLIKLC